MSVTDRPLKAVVRVSAFAWPWQSARMPTLLPATLPHLGEAPLVLRGFGEADVPLIQEVATDPSSLP